MTMDPRPREPHGFGVVVAWTEAVRRPCAKAGVYGPVSDPAYGEIWAMNTEKNLPLDVAQTLGDPKAYATLCAEGASTRVSLGARQKTPLGRAVFEAGSVFWAVTSCRRHVFSAQLSVHNAESRDAAKRSGRTSTLDQIRIHHGCDPNLVRSLVAAGRPDHRKMRDASHACSFRPYRQASRTLFERLPAPKSRPWRPSWRCDFHHQVGWSIPAHRHGILVFRARMNRREC